MQLSHLFAASILSVSVLSALTDSIGCFASVDTSQSQGFGQYETQSSCAASCGPSYPYVAIKNGGYCYCLSAMPTTDLISNAQCNVPCNGFGQVMCGGQNAFTVFVGAGSANSQLLLSSISSLQSISSRDASGTTSAPTHGTSVMVATTSDSNGSIIYKTVTQTSGSTSTSTGSKSKHNSESSSKSSSNVGAIVGGVVGGLAALALIGVGVFFFIRRRNLSDDDDDEDYYEKGGSSGAGSASGTITKPAKFHNAAFDRPMSNPFVHPSDDSADKRISRSELTDPRLNPIMMGRRRLSEGSLADEADYSRKILAVANP